MPSQLLSAHYASRVVLTLALVLLSFVIVDFVEGRIVSKEIFPFTGMIGLILITAYLYHLDGESLKSLGLNLSKRNTFFLFFGFLLGGLAFVCALFFKHLYTGQTLVFNPEFMTKELFKGLYYIFPMVVVEELLYRGYLFKKTVDLSSIWFANVIFAIIFMLVHALDSQVIHHFPKLIFVVVTITVGHLFFAMAFLKTKTLWFAIGLHFGNNWATRFLITESEAENSLFFVKVTGNYETWLSFLTFLLIWNGFYLLLTFVIWKWPVKTKINNNHL